jgi:hypothetical protein
MEAQSSLRRLLLYGAHTLLGILLALGGCSEVIGAADVVGTYRAELLGESALLVVKDDGTWEYHIAPPANFRRSGTWSTSRLKAWPAVLSFEKFEFGFTHKDFHSRAPGLWIPHFSRTNSGKVRELCALRPAQLSLCFTRVL